jgi:hypothetical protein
MLAFKVVRNVLGTAGIVYLGIILLESLVDAKRYLKISAM